MNKITIRGAKTHNLKNVDLDIPRDQLVVITGLSGSGKSSLAFDTLYAEGQRRYVESLSAYARQFLSMMEKPEVDYIEGLSPAISIEQKATSHNPRSTVGTVTEIYDYLRLLYARVGQPFCPTHKVILEAQTISQMVDSILKHPEGTRMMILAPLVENRKGEFIHLFERLKMQGFIRVRVNGEMLELDHLPELKLHQKHTIEVVIDRFKVRPDITSRLAQSIETGLNLTEGIVKLAFMNHEGSEEVIFSSRFACHQCGYSLSELEPRLFSFNNPIGACPTCNGLGIQPFMDITKIVKHPELSLANGAIRGWDKGHFYYFQILNSLAKHYHFDLDLPFEQQPESIQNLVLYGSGEEKILMEFMNDRGRKMSRNEPFEGIIPNMTRRYHETESGVIREELAKYLTIRPCEDCEGTRLRLEARSVSIENKTLPEISQLSIRKASAFFKTLKLSGTRQQIAEKILNEIESRLEFLINVGLDYLMINRSAETLSGGEAQRIRLASQIGSKLVGVMYVLDEPSIGLHQRDNERLLNTLHHLRNLGNTVIVVEHDEEAIRAADYIIDMGPKAGIHGGEVVAKGHLEDIIKAPKSITGQYLSGKEAIPVPKERMQRDPKRIIQIEGATQNNLKNVSVKIPIGLFTCITGVSGSGKSSLINDTLYPIAAEKLNGANAQSLGKYKHITGLQFLDKVVDIDQSPIGRTPRSNPATYTGIFTHIRDLFANTQEARARGYKVGRFSFNVKGGRCEACEGDGVIKVEMHFLSDIYVTCDQCKGKRYNRETLEIAYKGKNIYEILEMTIEEAQTFFSAIPAILQKLNTLSDVGLSYIKLGQNATTLSGGEAQRVKLSKELSRRDTGNTLYILDEPTTGLHFYDIKQLLNVLYKLKSRGNTILVIEHNLDVIKTADWIIDLGPEGGDGGGEIIATGTPEDIIKIERSYTGIFLKPLLLP